MRIKKNQTYFGPEVLLMDGENQLSFSYGCNNDMYWSMDNPKIPLVYGGRPGLSMDVSKDDKEIYDVFDKLFQDIIDINFYDSHLSRAEIDKTRMCYRVNNYSHYNELLSEDNKTITCYSEEGMAYDAGKPVEPSFTNYVQIIREEDSFHIEFVGGFGNSCSSQHISIKISGKHSRYNPFNLLFERMVVRLQEVGNIEVTHENSKALNFHMPSKKEDKENDRD